MTNKRNRFYQIGFFALAFAFITLCAYMGITAIQKSMTLNLSMQAKPSISCAIYINESLVFDNVTPQIADGVELTANTLKLNTTSVFGQSFNLKIENKNENAIYVTFSGATISGSTNYKTIIGTGNNNISDNLALSSAGTVTITMQQVVKVTTTPTNCTYTTDVSSGLISVSGSSYIPYGATLKQTFTSNTGYTSPPSINASMGGEVISNPNYTNDGLLTISNVTGDIVINATCGAITYTVAYYSNDGNTLITSETHTYGIFKALHSGSSLTPPSGKKFAGWSTSINATEKVYAGSQSVGNLTATNNATIKLYAVWESANINVAYNLTNINSTNTTTTMQSKTEFSTTLTVNKSAVNIDDYSLPEELDIQIGETVYTVSKYESDTSGITYSESYNYTTNQIEGAITIPEDLTIGDISITSAAEIAYWDGPDANITELLYVDGSGTQADPFLIATGKELASLNIIYEKDLEGEWEMIDELCFKLLKNIYLNQEGINENREWVPHVWEPIWTLSNQHDNGIFEFNGNNKKISGMYVNNQECAALFAGFAAEASISNLTLVNSYINGDCAAGICGDAYVLSYFGGRFYNITIGESGNTSSVVIEGGYTAGIYSGLVEGGIFFEECDNYATITGTSQAGGIAREIVCYSESYVPFRSCNNYGIVTSPNGDAGGLIGYVGISYGSFNYEDCHSYGTPVGKIWGGYDDYS